MRFLCSLIISFLVSIPGWAQSTNAPLNKDYYHLLDRVEILGGELAPAYHSAIKPYTRRAIAALLDSAQGNATGKGRSEEFNREYLAQDNWHWASPIDSLNNRPIWNTVYTYRSDFLSGADKKEAMEGKPQIHVILILIPVVCKYMG